MTTAEIQERLEALRVEFSLPAWQDEADLHAAVSVEEGGARYILLEEGHYGDTALSFHATPTEAGSATLKQEYVQDWGAICLLDIETGDVSLPETVVWKQRIA